MLVTNLLPKEKEMPKDEEVLTLEQFELIDDFLSAIKGTGPPHYIGPRTEVALKLMFKILQER